MHQNDHVDYERCRDELRVCVSVSGPGAGMVRLKWIVMVECSQRSEPSTELSRK